MGGSNNAIGYFADDKPPIEQTAYFTQCGPKRQYIGMRDRADQVAVRIWLRGLCRRKRTNAQLHCFQNNMDGSHAPDGSL